MDYNSTTIHLQGTPQKHKPPLKLDTSSLFAHFNEIDRKKSKGGKLSRKEKWLWNYESNVRKKLATAKGSGEGSTGQNERVWHWLGVESTCSLLTLREGSCDLQSAPGQLI